MGRKSWAASLGMTGFCVCEADAKRTCRAVGAEIEERFLASLGMTDGRGGMTDGGGMPDCGSGTTMAFT
jgi:hypothetical protein